MKTLNFYKIPFTKEYGIEWVYDLKGNFIFQFVADYKLPEGRLSDMILSIMNGVKPAIKLNLSISEEDRNIILLKGSPFILIRGWGNLTGTGAHNFSTEKAAKIQDDLANWIVELFSFEESPLERTQTSKTLN